MDFRWQHHVWRHSAPEKWKVPDHRCSPAPSQARIENIFVFVVLRP
jgi:hypothetical protein